MPRKGRISPLGIQHDPSQDWEAWEKFIKVHRTPDLVVILSDTGNFVALPRSFFSSNQDWKNLNQFVDQRVLVPV